MSFTYLILNTQKKPVLSHAQCHQKISLFQQQSQPARTKDTQDKGKGAERVDTGDVCPGALHQDSAERRTKDSSALTELSSSSSDSKL